MVKRLQGKVAVVTAAGQGIGRAIAEAFVREGATVWATDRDTDKLDGIAKAKRRKLDVLSDKAVANFAEKVGPIDILVNAAGFVHHGTVMECDNSAWDFSFDINVKSMHRMLRAFIPGMLARGSGSIVNIASGAGSVRGIPNRYVYGATKAAVIGLTKAVAADYIKKAFAPMRSAPARSSRPPWMSALKRWRNPPMSHWTPPVRPLLTASPWAVSGQPRKLPCWQCISPPTKPAIQPARSIWPMVVSRFKFS